MKSSLNLLYKKSTLIRVLAIVAVFILIPATDTQASVFSYVSAFLGSESAVAKSVPTTGPNLQTLALLRAANNIDPNPEKVADIIPVQAGDTLSAELAMGNIHPAHSSINTQVSTYIVQNGDTLSGIASMFGVSVNTILWANGITKVSGIQPGQTLIILPVSGISHKVKSGDTILGIVGQYKADLNEVLEYNDITLSSSLSVGQSIILPDVEITTSLPTRIIVGGPLSGVTSQSTSKYYIRPLKAGVRTQGIHGYNGVDLAAPIGTSVYASAEGSVIVSRSDSWNGGYGNFIIVTHPNGTQTLYAHLSKNLAKAGDYVEQGDKIGLVGNTGKSTGPHLHFEIRGAKNPF
jgi:murein DD-endopeptidase MepM/ murein hydrolase activator NlpD